MYPRNSESMIADPRVSVRISMRNPINPRDGTRNSSRTRPDPWFTIFAILPCAGPVFRSPPRGRRPGNRSPGFRAVLPAFVHRRGTTSGLPADQLRSFAPHHLYQTGELQFTPPHHFEGVFPFYANGNVSQQFFIEAVRVDYATSPIGPPRQWAFRR